VPLRPIPLAQRRVLVGSGGLGRAVEGACDAEARAASLPKLARLARDEFPQNLGERDAAPSRLSLEEFEVVALCGQSRPPNCHCI